MAGMKIAVVVPGILGSILYQDHGAENTKIELWGENLALNYRRLLDQPSALTWVGAPAKSRILKSVRASRLLPFVRARTYESLPGFAADLPGVSRVIETSYDWRDSVLNSCIAVINKIRAECDLDLTTPSAEGEPRLILIAHSLGGLVVRAAVAKALINTSRIDRIVYIGSPLYGAPVAFRAMYSQADLPFFSQVARLFRCLRSEEFNSIMAASFRTFPSLYELLPHQHIDFVRYSDITRTNPLKEDFLDVELHKARAIVAHDSFRKADAMLQSDKVPAFAVFTAASASFQTEYEYVARALAVPRGYEIIRNCCSNEGDGTVPAYSARGSDVSRSIPVVNCRHAFMCESKAVLRAISGVSSEMARTETKV